MEWISPSQASPPHWRLPGPPPCLFPTAGLSPLCSAASSLPLHHLPQLTTPSSSLGQPPPNGLCSLILVPADIYAHGSYLHQMAFQNLFPNNNFFSLRITMSAASKIVTRKRHPNPILSSVQKQGHIPMVLKAQMQELFAGTLPSISNALGTGAGLPATEDRRSLLRVSSLSSLN